MINTVLFVERDETEQLEQAIRDAPGRVFIVARGAAVLPVLRRLSARSADVAGALFVAPTKDAFIPIEELPILTTLVAPRDAAFAEAKRLARRLGSRLAVGEYDPALLEKLIARNAAAERALLASLALTL